MLNDFHYDRCAQCIRDGIIHALQLQTQYIQNIQKSKDYQSRIRALSFDVYPWHQYVALSIRLNSDTVENNPAEWSHFEFISTVECDSIPLKKAAEYITQQYESAEEQGISAREMAHLLFLASAEALLSSDVIILLQKMGVELEDSDDPLDFQRVKLCVWDVDESISANYCDIIRANRATEQIVQFLKESKGV
ncbi:MAG: hypothetical protein AAGA60_16595 [Cyanobacteria bacterium P01_E01_bin.42]